MKLVDKWVLILHQKTDEEIRETIQTRVIRRLPLKSTRELCILTVRQLRTGEGLYVGEEPVSLSTASVSQ